MAINKCELDNDFLGGQGALTKEEEKALNEFFKKRKIVNNAIVFPFFAAVGGSDMRTNRKPLIE